MSAEIYLHGAHVTHFQPRGARPVLWMSEQSHFTAGKPIRGGIPICFPWFSERVGHPDSPMHGFARLTDWTLDSVERRNETVEVRLRLLPDARGLALWPHQFEATLTAIFSTQLNLELQVTNTDKAPFSYEEALHSYFALSDVHQVEVAGLENVMFFSKVAGQRRAESTPIKFTGETDRVFNDTAATCVLRDSGWGRQIIVRKTGSKSTVVWNPWITKSAAMPDFGDDEWPGMACIESGNIGPDAVSLAPGASRTMRVEIQSPSP